MWLSQNQGKQETPRMSAEVGRVTACGAEGVTVQASREYRELDQLLPGGVDAPPAVGERTVVLPLASGPVCAGVLRCPAVQPGEVRLCSAGGASLWLRNDGTVVINGRVFEKEGEVLEWTQP